MHPPTSFEPEIAPSRAPAPARSSRLYTQWNYSPDGAPLHPERHALFERYVRETATYWLPWLFPVLDSAGAMVLAGLHSFCVLLPDVPDLWIDIPEMSSRLILLPWGEPHETPH
jgi:hypothetical protein